jgi:hypothetical protein
MARWNMCYKMITILFPLKTKWKPTNLYDGDFTWLTYSISLSTTNITSQVNEILLDFLGAFAKLRKATIACVMSACLSSLPSVRQSACISSAVIGRIFLKLNIWVFLKNLSTVQIPLNTEKNTGHFMWRPVYIFETTWRWIILRKRNFSGKFCG